MSRDQIESELRSIEHALHAALVRQLRVISLMALLLGVAGFFVGHFVAEEQQHAASAPLEADVVELQEQLAAVTARCERQESAHAKTLAALNQLEALRRDESAREAKAIHSLLADIENRRSMSLHDLETHVTERVVMPPDVVTAAINRFVDEHVLQLDRVLAVVERRLGGDAIAEARQQVAARAPAPPREVVVERSAPPPPSAAGSLVSTPASLSSPAVETSAPAQLAAAPQTTHQAHDAPESVAPQRRRLLFFSPNRRTPEKPLRVSGSDEIPLPPR